MRKIHLISLGCPRNLIDSEVMLGILLKAGWEITLDIQEADLILVNTCGFLKASRDESLSVIKESLRLRKKGARVVATGCMVQAFNEEIVRKCPNVDFSLGSGEIDQILQAATTPSKKSLITKKKSFLEEAKTPRKLSTPSHYAYLKIAEGCRKRCSYCIIPDIKGPLKSKTIQQIKKEFRSLRKQGVQEIILVAQDLGDWGKDLDSHNLVDLLKELLKEKGDYWLRLLYLYPDSITGELITLMQKDRRLLPYLDIPLQHIDPTILKEMGRKISQKEVFSLLSTLRDRIPEIIIRTSLIVGFPGETEKQFTDLISFLKEYRLNHVGVFKFSKESGSKAADKEGQISEKIKQRRYQKLMAVQKEIVEKDLQHLIGQTVEAFIEGFHPDSPYLMRARYWGQCPDVDGEIVITDGRKVTAFGKKYLVKIIGVAGYDLIGCVES